MATYYWVGGAGTWDATTTTNWAATSGGAGGAGVPTFDDDVIFDESSNVGTSAFTVTIAGTPSAPSVCRDFSTGGAGGALDGVMTIAYSANAELWIYGSITLPATNLTWSGGANAITRFQATTTGKTITTNGVTLTSTAVVFEGVGGEWTLGSAINTGSGNFVISSGSFNTNNFNVTCARVVSTGNLTRSITLGSSTVTSGGTVVSFTSTGLTFDAGTSQFTCTNGNVAFSGGGLTFYNVTFSSTAIGSMSIANANTYNNLTFAGRASAGNAQITFAADQIVNGTLSLTGSNGVNRTVILSNVLGTQRTFTVNAISALTDITIRDINAAGAAGTWAGIRLGDASNNTNITFDAPKTVYWNLAAGGTWQTSTAWAASSGAAPALTNFPLPQDIAVIENTGLNTSATITMSGGQVTSAIDASTRSNAMTIAFGTNSTILSNNITLSSAVTLTGTATPQITVARDISLTTAGVVFPANLSFNTPGFTTTLVDNLTVTSTATLNVGGLNLNNNTLSTGLFSSSNSNVRSIAFGTGNITVTGNNATVWTTSTPTNLTVTGTPTVNATYAGATGTRTITAGSERRFNFYITAGTDTVTSGGTSGFGILDFTGFAGTLSNAARLVNGNLTISSGMTLSAGASALTFDGTTGTQQITTAGKTFDFPITFNGIGGTFAFQDALTQGSTRAFTITNGTVQLKNGVTTTVGAFATSGTNQKFLQSTLAGSQATLSQASGTINASYLTIQDINATGGATWDAFVDQQNIDAGNNDGWNFEISPVVGGAEYTYSIRSFTQPRRF
jgi:hypothetical protein